jgi:sterol desaturase/sphingolipid hydroxylase (fatty acid hydroxylase superfamily)
MFFATTFFLAIFTGTFLEYISHRALHEYERGILHRMHWNHHKTNHAESWLLDCFTLYLPVAFPGILAGSPLILLNWWLFLGWASGGIFYVFLFSFCHFIQHDYPEYVFWMRYPVHHFHHRYNRGKGNYGVVVDWWDRLFNTYNLKDNQIEVRTENVQNR